MSSKGFAQKKYAIAFGQLQGSVGYLRNVNNMNNKNNKNNNSLNIQFNSQQLVLHKKRDTILAV